MRKYICLLAALLVTTGAAAQNKETLRAEDGLFNHLSVGLSMGLLGTGLDVAMPVHRLVTVRAGVAGWSVGDIRFKAISTASELSQMELVEDDAVRRAAMSDKIELAVKPKFWNAYLLAEVHPFKNETFHFTAGLFVGCRQFLHFRNTNDGALDFLYDANQKVEDYNRAFHTAYKPVGLKFGDYVFTADENGNIDVKMKTNAVKPYLGIGFGPNIARNHRVSVNFEAGLLFWGTPKFVLNDETEIKSSNENAGITSVLSWLKAWPALQLRVAYKIF